jgi:hypothetical protein
MRVILRRALMPVQHASDKRKHDKFSLRDVRRSMPRLCNLRSIIHAGHGGPFTERYKPNLPSNYESALQNG